MQDNGSNIISGYIGLRPRSERTLSQDEVSDKLRKLLASYPELSSYSVTTGGGANGNNTSGVTLEIYRSGLL